MKTFVCPTCEHEQPQPIAKPTTGIVDLWCDVCSGALRLRFFRGRFVDVEDLDYRQDTRTG